MKKLFVFVLAFLCFAGIACTPAAAPTAATNAAAANAVKLAADGWNLAAAICSAEDQANPDAGVEATCAKYLVPAHDLIADAAAAVDQGWTSSAACNLVQGVELLASAGNDHELKLPSEV